MPRKWHNPASGMGGFTGDIESAVLEALNRLGTVSDDVRALLNAGHIERALDALPWADAMTALERRIYRIALLVQARAARQTATRHSLGYTFDLSNPEAIRSAQKQAGDLIREVTVETRLAVRDIIVRGQRDGVTVVEQAQLIRQHVGLTRRQATAVYNFRRGLEARGVPPARIERMVERKREQGVAYRARTIARTETLAASNAGTQEIWRQGVERGIIPKTARRVWVASPDACPHCKPMNGQLSGMQEYFRSGSTRTGDGRFRTLEPVLTPPLHPNCRCSLSLEVAA